ncbi:MAG: hypothetical protein ABI895_21425 [Deltaproteobacteria bacterium]
MAFEAILSQQQAMQSGRLGSLKLWVSAFTVLLHAIGLAFLVVQSIWTVDELPMPAIEVTLSVAPPPPPPPPPAKRSSTKKTKPVETKPKVLTVPKETKKEDPPPEPEEESEDEGVEGGVIGGMIGGVLGGTVPPPPKSTGPKLLSARAGHSLLAINPQIRPYRVNVPEEYVQRGDEFVATLSICVAPNGSVSSVKILKPSIPVIDVQIPKVIPTWKYRPYIVDGQPTGFCYNMNYRVK